LNAFEHAFDPFTVKGEPWLDIVRAKQFVELLCQAVSPAGPVRASQTYTGLRWLKLSGLIELKGRADVGECSSTLQLDESRLNYTSPLSPEFQQSFQYLKIQNR
jgi:hypothetical protein